MNLNKYIDYSLVDRFAVLMNGGLALENMLISSGTSQFNMFVMACIFWALSNRNHITDDYQKIIDSSRKKALLEALSVYDSMISDYITLQEKFDVKNPLDITSFYTYMYRNGILSEKNAFRYSIEPKYDLPNFFELDVINGEGCCRNIASFLHNILDKCDMKNFRLQAYHPSGEDSFVKRKYGNHLIVAVFYENHRYLLDPTNNTLLTGSEKIVSDGKHNISLCLTASTFDHISNRDKKKIINLVDGINLYEGRKQNKKIWNMCEKNRDILYNFYLDEFDKYREINEKLTSVANSLKKM